MFKNFIQEFENLDEDEVTFWYLVQANKTSEWMWTLYFKYMAAEVFSLAGTSLISVLYCYLTQGNFDTRHFYRPAKFLYAI